MAVTKLKSNGLYWCLCVCVFLPVADSVIGVTHSNLFFVLC